MSFLIERISFHIYREEHYIYLFATCFVAYALFAVNGKKVITTINLIVRSTVIGLSAAPRKQAKLTLTFVS